MAKYSIEDTSLTAIADAIRAKTGKEDALTLDGMAAAVAGLNVAGKNVEFIGLIDRTITEAVSEDVTGVGSYAFHSCKTLESVRFPNATNIGDYAFYGCTSLERADLSNITSVGLNVFYGCGALESADFPKVTSVENYMFYNCKALESGNFPNAASIGTSAFQYCDALKSVDFPIAQSVGQNAFFNCKALASAAFPRMTSIGVQAFRQALALTTLILSGDTVRALKAANAFASTPIESGTGYIYVPAALVDSYKAATNWSTYADQIRAIEDYPDITGGAA